jgi:hypothetical protein
MKILSLIFFLLPAHLSIGQRYNACLPQNKYHALVRTFLSCPDSTRKSVKIGDTTVGVVGHRKKRDPQVVYINVHEDEQTSIDVLIEYSKHSSINYWYLKHGNTRRINFTIDHLDYDIDPNRIYTDKGVVRTLKDGLNFSEKAVRKVRKFGKKLMSRVAPRKRKMVVTLHNNTPDNYSILSYKEGGDEWLNTADLYINPDMDPDDFIYTTDRWMFDQLKEKNINVILQDNSEPVDDGSMSVYCGFEGIPYINIEAEHGHFDTQLELLEVIDKLVQIRLELDEKSE